MGVRGPVPNRSTDLSRDRDVNKGGRVPITKGQSLPATIPEPDPEWHNIATLLWHSAIESGQAAYYESSDYAYLYSLCEDLSYYKSRSKRSGQMLTSIYSAMSNLLITEGDRRRVRIELEDEQLAEDDATVIAMDAYKQALGLAN